MTYNFPFIELSVSKKLDPEIRKLWYDTVESAGPPSIVGTAEIRYHNQLHMVSKIRKTGTRNVHYVVVLNRDLTVDEAEKIAVAWNRAERKINFAINFSQINEMTTRLYEISNQKLAEIIETVARRHHMAWYQKKTQQGWGYGPRLDNRNKKHPMLVPWESLSDKYQEQEYDQIQSLFDALESLNLKITRD